MIKSVPGTLGLPATFMTNKRLLLFSNGSELIGREPTEFARRALKDFLGAEASHRCQRAL